MPHIKCTGLISRSCGIRWSGINIFPHKAPSYRDNILSIFLSISDSDNSPHPGPTAASRNALVPTSSLFQNPQMPLYMAVCLLLTSSGYYIIPSPSPSKSILQTLSIFLFPPGCGTGNPTENHGTLLNWKKKPECLGCIENV